MRFPGFEGEWENRKLGDIANIYDGIHQTPKYVNEGVKFVSVENINNLDSTNKFITREAFDKEYKIKPKKGDILMTRITAGIIGATAIIQNNEPLAYYVSLALIRIKEKVGVDFLKCSIETNQFKKELNKRIIHVAFPKKINLRDIQECTTSFPLLAEQNKIAKTMTAINGRIETQNKILRELNVLKSSLAKKIFQRKFYFNKEAEFLQDGWREMKMKDVAIIKMGQSPQSLSYNTEKLGVPLIQGNADILNRISYPRQYTSSPTRFCEVGDLLLTVRAPVGFVAKSRHQACIGRGVCSIKNRENSVLEYIYQFLLYYENRWKSIEQGSIFTAVNSLEIESISIMIPSIAEQTKIAKFLSMLDVKIELEINILEQIEKQKKMLLSEMFV